MKQKQNENTSTFTVQSPTPLTSASTTVDDRATAFRAVDNTKESVAGGPLLIAAYALLWLIVLILIVRIFQRQNKMAKNLDSLELTLNRVTHEK